MVKHAKTGKILRLAIATLFKKTEIALLFS
jgi:hypothetical protein